MASRSHQDAGRPRKGYSHVVSDRRSFLILGAVFLAACALAGIWLSRRTTEELPTPGSYADDRLPVAQMPPQWLSALDGNAAALRACGASGAITIDLSFKKDGTLHQARPHPSTPAPPWAECARAALSSTHLDPLPAAPVVTRYHWAL